MSAGHRHGRHRPLPQRLLAFITDDALRIIARWVQEAKVSRVFDIPLTAGCSPDHKNVYIARQVAKRLTEPKSGKTFDPALTLPFHELAELFMMDEHGLVYLDAHKIGNHVEQVAAQALGLDWRGYCELFDGIIEEVERAPVVRCPANLEMRPYIEGAPELVEAVRRAQGMGKATRDEIDAAASMADPDPTDGQKEAGNYRKGHVDFQGIDVTIENARGSERSGVGADGKPWTVRMPAHYGYIKRTLGNDGDHVDVYIGPEPDSTRVFVVDQVKAGGDFDEHKVMLGYPDEDAAMTDYVSAFSDGRGEDRIGGVTELSMDDFKVWLEDGDMKSPMAKYDLIDWLQKKYDAAEWRDAKGRWSAAGPNSPQSLNPDTHPVDMVNPAPGHSRYIDPTPWFSPQQGDTFAERFGDESRMSVADRLQYETGSSNFLPYTSRQHFEDWTGKPIEIFTPHLGEHLLDTGEVAVLDDGTTDEEPLASMAKFDQNEQRDERGRWTSGAIGASPGKLVSSIGHEHDAPGGEDESKFAKTDTVSQSTGLSWYDQTSAANRKKNIMDDDPLDDWLDEIGDDGFNVAKYSDQQPRDERGRWTVGGEFAPGFLHQNTLLMLEGKTVSLARKRSWAWNVIRRVSTTLATGVALGALGVAFLPTWAAAAVAGTGMLFATPVVDATMEALRPTITDVRIGRQTSYNTPSTQVINTPNVQMRNPEPLSGEVLPPDRSRQLRLPSKMAKADGRPSIQQIDQILSLFDAHQMQLIVDHMRHLPAEALILVAHNLVPEEVTGAGKVAKVGPFQGEHGGWDEDKHPRDHGKFSASHAQAAETLAQADKPFFLDHYEHPDLKAAIAQRWGQMPHEDRKAMAYHMLGGNHA